MKTDNTSVERLHALVRSAAGLAIVLALASCPVHPRGGIGSLTLALDDPESGAKTIAPPVDMVSASFDIALTGPGDPVSVTGHTGTSIQFPSLEAGLWTIEVLARNATGSAILEGSAEVSVDPSSNASATVTLAPVDGQGALAIGISWPAGIVSSPSVSGSIGRMGETPTPVTPDLSGDGRSATLAIASIDSGYHVLSLELRDGATALCRIMESVRIVAGATTTASFALQASDINGVPSAASSLTVTMVSTSSLSVTWQDNSYNEAGFRLQRSTDGSAWSDIAALPYDTRSAADSGLQPNTRYYYRVIAFNAYGESASTAASGTTDMLIAPVPSIAPNPGTYASPQSVTLTCDLPGAVIRYTVNGSVPSSTNGHAYSAPFTVNSSVTLRAAATLDGYHDSPVATAAIVISNSVSTPVFSPAPGVYHAPRSVTLSSATVGAAINYTTDGSDPGEFSGTIYSGALSLPEDKETTIKAIAKLSGSTISDISSATYRKIAQPVLSPSPGTFTPSTGTQDISITVPTSRTHTIKYTVDGTDPSSTNGLTYSGPFSIDRNRQVKAIALYDGSWGNSLVVSGNYTIQCVAPVFALPAGPFGSDLSVLITSQTPGSIVVYTTNGSTPSTTNGTYYTGPFTLNSSTTVYAVATKPNCMTSSSVSRYYSLGYGTQTPSNGSETSVLPCFDWPDIVRAQGYRIQVNTALDFTGEMRIDSSDLTSSTFQTSTPLTLGTTYYWRISASYGASWTAWSTPFSFTVADIFAKAYGGTSFDHGYAISRTSDGGSILAGSEQSFGSSNPDIWVIKKNQDDSIAWQKTYGGPDIDFAYSVQETLDNGFIIAGRTSSFGTMGDNAWIVKLNSAGLVQWEREYGGTISDTSAASIAQCPDGGFVIAGSTYSFGSGREDAWAYKIDSSGALVWQRAYGGPNDDSFNSIISTPGGGYLAVGTTNSAGAGDDDAWAVKLDESGFVEWQKTYGCAFVDTATAVRRTTGDGYIIAGSTATHSGSFTDFLVIKIDGNGGMEWQKAYEIDHYEYSCDIQQTSDGGYVVTGNAPGREGLDDILVLKTDDSGAVSWAYLFGGVMFEYGYGIIQYPDGGYSVIGSTSSFGTGNTDLWNLKIKANGTCGSLGITSSARTRTPTCAVGIPDLASQATTAIETPTSCTVTTTDCAVTTQI